MAVRSPLGRTLKQAGGKQSEEQGASVEAVEREPPEKE